MNRRMTAFTMVLVASMVFCACAAAALTLGQEMAADVLIKQFSAREFAVRQQAVERLIALGPDVVPLIRKTLAKTDDNEIRFRCESVLKGIAEKHGIDTGVAKPGVAKDFGFDASRVTVKLKDADLDEILQEFADQSGNRPITLPDNWEGEPLTFEVKDMPYWEALDKLCAEAKLMYAGDNSKKGGIKLIPAMEDIVDIGAHKGPVVVKLEGATMTRQFRRPATRRGSSGRLTYRFNYFWEDRLAPIDIHASITRVTDAGGREMKITSHRGWRGNRPPAGNSASIVTVNITEVPDKLEKLGELTGTVKLTFGSGKAELRIEDVFGEGDKTGAAGDVMLTVTKPRRTRNWAWLNISQTVGGKNAPIPNYPADSRYSIYLIDPNGKRHAGTVRGVRMIGAVAGPGASSSVHFRRLPKVEGAWALLYVMPEKTSEKEFPFTFTNVRLP